MEGAVVTTGNAYDSVTFDAFYDCVKTVIRHIWQSRVELKLAAMNLKKLIVWRWNRHGGGLEVCPSGRSFWNMIL